eukprot:CAMPEP_0172664118 /NCGR_PEP_ID=MMETSP1074-20121228/6375_1 /TAXON_ID=2916 /ORGANISM="Ceratium fusus, Strain PA161109" /LENGTH=431 /DNA_ID=CAMNT_0013480213 /DNA_START=50 /DNA_END=1345 /DNA_ORIENTATION=+
MSKEVAATTALIATMAVGTLGRASGLPTAAVPVYAPPPVLTSIGSTRILANENFANENIFVKAADSQATWFLDTKAKLKHLVRFKCDACGEPPPCENARDASTVYINSWTTGEDFSCQMLHTSPVRINTPRTTHALATTRTTQALATTSTSTSAAAAAAAAAAGGSSSGAGWIFFILLIVCCCSVGIAFAIYHFMTRKKKPSKTKKQGQKRPYGAEDRVPLVQDEAPHFGSSNRGASEQMTATAPTYTAMAPQMGQAAMAAQAQMPTYTRMGDQQQLQQGQQQQPFQMQHATMPTQTAMMGQTNMGQTAMPTQSWCPGTPSPGQRDSFVAAQAAMQTMVLEQPPAMQQASMQTMVLEQPPGTQAQACAVQPGQGSFALGTQAAFPSMYQQQQQQQQQQQEMELVTITPSGYSVTPLAAGSQVPAGVPVYNN